MQIIGLIAQAGRQLPVQEQDRLIEEETQQILGGEQAKAFRWWSKTTQREHVIGQLVKRLGKEAIERELRRIF